MAVNILGGRVLFPENDYIFASNRKRIGYEKDSVSYRYGIGCGLQQRE
jgi:hypothetical protein